MNVRLCRNPKLKPINHPMRKLLFLNSVLMLLLTFSPLYAEVLSTDAPPAAEPGSEMASAKITSLEGDVRILKKDASDWEPAEKDQAVEAGDQILTGKNSSADIAYDNYLLNITHIQELTKAEFRSIEPTDIYLEDGSIYSALDGLGEDGEYQIATPTAVAAVRGTHFDVAFDQRTQKFTSAALSSGEEGHESIIYIRDPKNLSQEPLVLRENKQMDLRFGEKIEMNRVRAAEPRRVEAGQKVFHQMGQRMPQFQERRGEGKIRLEERKNSGGPSGPNGPNGPNSNGPHGPHSPQGHPQGPGQKGPQMNDPQRAPHKGMENFQKGIPAERTSKRFPANENFESRNMEGLQPRQERNFQPRPPQQQQQLHPQQQPAFNKPENFQPPPRSQQSQPQQPPQVQKAQGPPPPQRKQ